MTYPQNTNLHKGRAELHPFVEIEESKAVMPMQSITFRRKDR